jgi:predicted transcriptional regulator
MKTKILTKAEEQIMQVLWELGIASVTDVIKELSGTKPAYNTVSTIIRILENKKFVGHEQKGRGYLYFPLVERETYSQQTAKKLVDNYFEGSFKSMVSFFVKKKDIDINELEEILKQMNK